MKEVFEGCKQDCFNCTYRDCIMPNWLCDSDISEISLDMQLEKLKKNREKAKNRARVRRKKLKGGAA